MNFDKAIWLLCVDAFFEKNLVFFQSMGPKSLALGSQSLANFQLILDCFVPNFKLKSEDSENVKGFRKY